MENRILFLFILLLVGLGISPLELKAQLVNNGAQVTIVNKGVLYVNGDLINQRSVSGLPNFSACLGPQIIVTGNLINNSGTEFFFAGDSSLVVMKGSSLQLIQGTDSINFFRLQIANASDSVKLERSISVIDSLMMQSGYVNLNGQDINLNATGYLTGETASTFIFGDSGKIFLQRPIFLNASPKNIGGLGASIQSSSNLGLTIITRFHQSQNVANVNSGFRYFDIRPSFAVTDQTLVFNYFDHELNGITESDLQLYHSLDNGQTWSIQNAMKNTALNTLNDNTSQFPARYTMADDVCKLNPVVVDLGNDTATCVGDSITLNALNSGSDFIWSTNETTATIKVVAGTYSVTVTSAIGCTGIDTILIIQNPQPIVQTSNDTVICTGQPLTIGDLNPQLPNTNSYLWNTAATTQTISINTATARIDTFIYTITTPAGCSITDSVRVEIIAQPLVNLGNDTALCQLQMMTLSATNAGATYMWSTGAMTSSIQVNSTSTYSVTVTNGICQSIDTIEVIKSNLISTTLKTDINCNGNGNGTAEVTGLNGITPYSYVWNNNATSKVITSLTAGKYYATLTDSIGCTVVSDTMEILEPAAINLSFAVTNESCNTGGDGSIDLTPTGGTGTLSFNWSTSTSSATISTGEDLTNLTSRKYIITVTDVNNCTKADSVSIIRPNGFTVTENFTTISCNGVNDATVNYSLSGGTAPFTFSWSNSSADSVQANLSAGTYSVLIQDANNCSYRDTVIVINPPVILSSLVGTNLTCFNNASGAINLTPSGGTGAFTFNWSTSTSSVTISTSEDLINVVAGNYKVTITDGNGCQKLDSIVLTEPIAISSSLTANAVSCNGSSDGTISSSLLGGTQPYTYLWSNGLTTSSITNLIAGKYLVTISDLNACQKLDSAIVTEPAALAVALDSSFNVSCFGFADGSVFTSTTGGTTPHTFSWNTSTGSATFATTDDVSNLIPGSYQLIVTDANGCQDSVNTTITEPIQLTTSISSTNISCNSANDGGIDLTTIGGTTPYTYLWSTSTSSATIATTEDLTNVAPGNYKVTIIDGNGCQKLDSVIISEPTGLTLSIVGTDVSCHNSMDGSADLMVVGGTQPYTFNWSTSTSSATIATSQDISMFTAGTYIVTVTDANGCQKLDSTVITEPAILAVTLDSSFNVSCFGLADGSVFTSTSGGTTPYTFSWSTSTGSAIFATTEVISNLFPGSYKLMVTDANACQDSVNTTITEPVQLNSLINSTNVSCNSANDGTIDLSTNGGTSPYTYLWSTSTSSATIATTEDLTNVAPGNYKVSIFDRNGCQKLDSVIITEPAGITLSILGTDVSCNSSMDGSADLTVVGGTQPYTFNWSTSTSSATIATSQDISMFTAGTYLVTVTDANGCQKLDSTVIAEPVVLTLALDSSFNVSCFGLVDGRVFTSTTGGTPPYTFSWNTSAGSATFATTEDISNLFPGSYKLFLTDANGCQDSVNTTITEPVQLTSSISSINVSCNSLGNGSIDLTTNGGTTPYTYLWSTSTSSATAIATTEDLTNVVPGNYKVTITDGNACQKLDSVRITEPVGLTLSIVGTNVSCYDGTNGIADLTVSGGTTPYSYLWSTAATNQDISMVLTGTYLVTVTDVNSCSKVDSIAITQPDSLTITAQITQVTCFGTPTGAIDLTVGGGTSAYSFMWSNAMSIEDLSNVQAGNYQVTVTDLNSCSKVESFTITENSDLIVSTSVVNSNCNQSDGSATVSASGGITPYTYLWRGNGVITSTNSNLAAGNYTVIVTDGVGCQDSAVASIGNLSGPSITLDSVHNVNCFGDSSGFINVTIGGGATPYVYAWSTSANSATISATEDIAMLSTGTYNLNVTDNNNCVAVQSYTITQGDSIQMALLATNVSCFNAMDGVINSNLIGGSGPLMYSWSNSSNAANLSNLDTGMYVLTVQDSLGCSVTDSVQIYQPDSLQASFGETDVTCNGLLDGSIDLTVIGGNGTYTYNWSTSTSSATIAFTEDISNLAAAKYLVIITDGSGCSIIDSAIVGEPMPLIYTDSVTSINCEGDSSGAIILSVSGGTAPYTYNWTNGESTATIDSLKTGTYGLTISDNNGCSLTNSYTLTQPAAFSLFVSSTDITGNGLANGTATASTLGGSGSKTFVWSSSTSLATIAITASVSNLAVGTYYVIATDSLGCTQIDSVDIAEPTSLNSTITPTDLSCNGDFSGSIDLLVTGGITPYTFNWSTSTSPASIAITEDISNLAAAKYFVTITDGNRISVVDSAIVGEPMPLVFTDSVTSINCGGDSSGAVILTVSGGTIPYTYNWAHGESTAIIDSLKVGNYVVTITDNNGCSLTNSYTLTQPTAFSLFVSSTDVTGNGLANGTAAASTLGGSGSKTFVWSSSTSSATIAITASVSNLAVGKYYVTATDSLGCTQIDSVDIAEPTLLNSTITPTDLSCNGDFSGSIDLLVTGGVTPYTFNWSTSTSSASIAITEDISNLSAAKYLVTITDGNSISRIDSATVGQPMPLVFTDSVTPINCGGDSSGAVILTVSGGTTPYTYNWTNGDSTATIDTLKNGTYAVTITDNNGCSLTNSYTLTEPTAFSLFVSSTDITCNGLANGTATASTLGGSGSKTFVWSTSTSSATIAITASVSGLSVGKYYVTATDSLGCPQVDSVGIAEPTLMTSILASTNLSCNGDFSGSVDLSVTGGTTPYTFNWSTSISSATIAITEDISNLSAAKYLVTITDGNNCQIIDSTTINQPDTIALAASIQQVFCAADSSGIIALTITGGTQPYSYAWSNGASVDSISKLIAGTYSVTVTDANFCSQTATYQITEPSVLSILLNASIVSCGGDSTGMITSVASGGVAPYSYAWSNGAFSSSIQNLKAGTYYLTISESNGCQLIDTASINQNSTLQASILKTDISCNGSANGTLRVTVSGGTTPYSYLWNDFSTSQNRNNLNSGIYMLTVSDNLGCSVVLFDTIVEPSALTVMADANNVSCSGAGNASIKLSVSGGVAPYSYDWSNLSTSDSIGGLAGGTYLVTITDQNSCSTTRSYRLTNPDPIRLNTTVANIGCGSSAKGGSIRIAATGGTTPYTYMWTNGETTAVNDSLGVGNYSVTLTDASGCISSSNFTIQLEGNPIFARYLSASFATSADTISFVNLSYPSPASYTWNMGDSTILNQTDVLHSYRSRKIVDGDSSFYDIRLLADNGTCVDSINKRITIRNLGPLRKGLDSISRYDTPFIEEVNLYPVPAKNVLNYKLILGMEDEMTVRIYTLEQKLLKTYNLSNAKEHGGKFSISELAKGLYIITFDTSTDQQSIRFIKM